MVVRSVVGEESQLKQTEETLFQSLSSTPVQVGLVVGKLLPHSDRGFVYALLPTPPPADSSESSACVLTPPPDEPSLSRKKKGSDKTTSSPALSVDSEWVAEHARQVTRMLVGGMNVVGIYIWASEGSFKASMPLMHQVSKMVAQVAPIHSPDVDERLLIHISYSPRRWTCRNCMLTSMSSNFQPCDFKMGKLLSSLQYFRCMYNFEIRFPVYHKEMNSIILREVLQNGIKFIANDLKVAKPLINGNLVNEDQQCPSEGPHDIQLLFPFTSSAPMEVCKSDEIAGIVVFAGTLCAYAYLGLKLPTSQAIDDIKGDFITSLQSRLDIIMEESEDPIDIEKASTDVSEGKCESRLVLSKDPHSVLFPKRVLVPWLPGIFICDYLKHSDTFEDVKDHCKEMLSMETQIDTSTIVEQEKEARGSITASSFWDAAAGAGNSIRSCLDNNDGRGSAEAKGHSGTHSNNNNLLIALAVAVLSLLVGWYLIHFRSNS